MKVRHLNNLPEAEVEERLGNIYESSPWIVRSGLQWRPFADIQSFQQKLVELVDTSADDEKLDLIRAHPDLVGSAALRGTLTPQSHAEQREAGLGMDDLSPDEQQQFADLNAAYQDRFGFPFVICVRENRKRKILAAFRVRLEHDSTQEIGTALQEIHKIAGYRLADVFSSG